LKRYAAEWVFFAGRRLGLAAAVFVAASLLLFAAVRAVPGDPVALRLKNPDPAQVAAERARLGLDRPLPEQWTRSVAQFLSGDWGRSLRTGRQVRADFAVSFPATLELSVAGLLLGVFFGAAMALLAEGLQARWLRRLAAGVGTLGLTVPIFWIGLLALLAGSLWLGWFPAGGRFDLARPAPPTVTGLLTVDALLAGEWTSLAVALRYLALPALCLALYPAAQVCAVLQARLRERRLGVLVRALRARGYGPWRIWGRHVARLLGPAVVTAAGSNFGMLLGGAVLVESVFSWPGLGRYLVGAVLERDLYVVQHVLLAVVVLVVGVVMLADLCALLINPALAAEERRREAGLRT